MSQRLLHGFRIGSWDVEPLRGAVIGPDGELRHLEPRVMDVLVYLASHAGTLVPRAQILDDVWGNAIVSDEPLTRAIGELRRTLGDDRHKPAFIETVPKRGYRLVAEVVAPVDISPPPAPEVQKFRADGRSQRLIAFAVVLIVAIMAMIYSGWGPEVEPLPGIRDAPESSIAVLPFRNLSGNAEDGYFVNGIQDDIVTQLAKLTFLDKVISRTSTERYRNTTMSIGNIGRELGVANILEGAVQRDGDIVRLNVQLVDTATDEHLWADSFEKDLTTANLFAIQAEITTSIANALQVVMTSAEEEQLALFPTENLNAYDEYLAGKQAMSRRTVDKLMRARQHFENAITLDPGFSLAFAGLADTINLLIVYGGLSEADFNRVESAARRALRLNDRLGEAHAALGFVEWRRGRINNSDFAPVDRYFREAQRLAPGYAPAYQWHAMALKEKDRDSEAIRLMRRAISLSPLDPNLHSNLGNIQSYIGDNEVALDSFHRALEIDPAWTPAMVELGYYYMANGDPVASITWLRKALAADPSEIRATARLITNYLALGANVEAEYWYRRLQNMPMTFWQPLFTIIIEISRGNHAVVLNEATRLLEVRPSCRMCVEIMTYELTANGEAARAVALVEERFPELFESPEAISEIRKLHILAPLGYALIEAGRGDDARRILAGGLAAAARQPRNRHGGRGLELADVRMHLLLGEREEALFTLRQAITSGWRFSHPHYPYLLELFGDEPRYHEIVAQLRADAEQDRRRLRAMEERGELPPIPPLAGTSEKMESASERR